MHAQIALGAEIETQSGSGLEKITLTPASLGAGGALPGISIGGLIPVSKFSCSYQPNSGSSIWTCSGAVDLGSVFGGESKSGEAAGSPAGEGGGSPAGGESGGGGKCNPESAFPTVRLSAGIQINPFALASLGFSVTNASFDIEPPDPLVVVTGFGANFVYEPNLAISGSVDLGAGPCIDGERPFDATGTVTGALGSKGFSFDVEGQLDLNLQTFKTQLAKAKFEYASQYGSTKISFSVNAGLTVDGFGISGNIDGALTTHPFVWQAGLGGQINAFGASVSGQGVLSNAGFGGCGTLHVAFWSGSVGFKHFFSNGQTDWDGCDFSGLYTVTGAGASALGQPRIVLVPRGASRFEIAVGGAGGVPAVKLVSPTGQVVTVPGTPNRLAVTGNVLAVNVPGTRRAYFVIDHPHAGAWKVVPLPGAPEPTSVLAARPYVSPAIHVSVTRHGRRERLSWRLRSQPGQSVRFFESGHAVYAGIAQSSRAQGSVEFTPAAGPGGIRRILAVVSVSDARYELKRSKRVSPKRPRRRRKHR